VDAKRRRVDRDVAVVRHRPVGPNEHEVGDRRRANATPSRNSQNDSLCSGSRALM